MRSRLKGYLSASKTINAEVSVPRVMPIPQTYSHAQGERREVFAGRAAACRRQVSASRAISSRLPDVNCRAKDTRMAMKVTARDRRSGRFYRRAPRSVRSTLFGEFTCTHRPGAARLRDPFRLKTADRMPCNPQRQIRCLDLPFEARGKPAGVAKSTKQSLRTENRSSDLELDKSISRLDLDVGAHAARSCPSYAARP